MKYYKSKGGYFYKEYKNNNKKRISQKEYYKLRKKDKQKGGSNPPFNLNPLFRQTIYQPFLDNVGEGTNLCIMRHSLRLDNELDDLNRSLKLKQKYYSKNSYNTPLANQRYTDPQVDFIGNQADDKIRTSVEALQKTEIYFNCIVTSPFTRCLQTTELVKNILGINIENVFINFNLREVDTALQRYNNARNKDFDTIEPYDKEFISSLNYKIDKYKKQSVNEIFNDKKKLGNVLLITHGDIFNEYIKKEDGIGVGMLNETGWGNFYCLDGNCPEVGTTLPTHSHEYTQIVF